MEDYLPNLDERWPINHHLRPGESTKIVANDKTTNRSSDCAIRSHLLKKINNSPWHWASEMKLATLEHWTMWKSGFAGEYFKRKGGNGLLFWEREQQRQRFHSTTAAGGMNRPGPGKNLFPLRAATQTQPRGHLLLTKRRLSIQWWWWVDRPWEEKRSGNFWIFFLAHNQRKGADCFAGTAGRFPFLFRL